MHKYLVQFIQEDEDFRLPELLSLAELNGVDVSYAEKDYSLNSPFAWINFPSDEAVRKVLERALLVKAVYRIWAHSDDVDDVYQQLAGLPAAAYGACIQNGQTFRVDIESFGKKVSNEYRLDVFKRLAVIPFDSQVKLKEPDHTLVYIEDYGNDKTLVVAKDRPDHVYVGVLVAQGSARRLMHAYALTDRTHIGTTSMDPKLSLICANMAWARPNTLMYDMFAGTCSLLIACAHFGAYTMGTEIDGRVLRGADPRPGKKGNVKGSFKQYGIAHRLVDVLTMDFAHNAWRTQELYDLIVCDPPYGIREDARKIGFRKQRTKPIPEELTQPHVPMTMRYTLAELLHDLLDFSARHLQMGGRMCYWLPVYRSQYRPEHVPQHPSLTLVANSENSMTQRWARRLITMKKTAPYTPGPPVTQEEMDRWNHFRDKVFMAGDEALP